MEKKSNFIMIKDLYDFWRIFEIVFYYVQFSHANIIEQ